MKSIPERITMLRKAAGLTQVELAALLGLTTGAICNYEKGRRPIRADAFEKIKTLAFRNIPENNKNKHSENI